MGLGWVGSRVLGLITWVGLSHVGLVTWVGLDHVGWFGSRGLGWATKKLRSFNLLQIL
jgi:hypothetical protein